jgi:hypothetical protein
MDEIRENQTITWEAFDKQDKERKVDWFWALGIIGITGSVLAFIFDNFLFGVFILLAIVVLIFLVSQKKRKVSYKLDAEGIHMDNELIPYKKMFSFYLDETGEWAKILIHVKHPISPIVGIYYEDKSLGDTIYQIFVNNEVKEEYLVEPISHQIFEKLGF